MSTKKASAQTRQSSNASQEESPAVERVKDISDSQSYAKERPDAAHDFSETSSSNSREKKGKRHKGTTTSKQGSEDREAFNNSLNGTDSYADVGGVVAAKTKRKRGRPRKSEPTIPKESQDQSAAESDGRFDKVAPEKVMGQGRVAGEHPRDRDKPESHDQEETGESDDAEAKRARITRTGEEVAQDDQVLKEKCQNSPAISRVEMVGGGEELPLVGENKPAVKRKQQEGKEGESKSVAAGGGSKIHYRVGLSKRSRIAPLLKSLRK